MRSLVATAMPIVSVCHTCGVVKKSDKRSCCARGGSWYGKCGGAGNTNREHTWYEGLQACKALQSQAVMVHQQNVVEQKNTNISDNASMVASGHPHVTIHIGSNTIAKDNVSYWVRHDVSYWVRHNASVS